MSFKHTIIGIAVALFAFAGVATGASALVINDFGTIAVPGAASGGNQPPVGAFQDQYEFKSAFDANVEAEITILNSTGEGAPNFLIDITTVTFKLFQAVAGVGVGNTPTADGSALATVLGVSGNQVLLEFAGLTAGTPYYLEAIGTASGTNGGNYAVLLNLSQVPLPPAIWLLISALMGLVSFSRIRRTKQTAQTAQPPH